MTLACPYCNAHVAATPGMSAGQRVQCPRCGQVFTLDVTPESTTTPGVPPAPEPERPERGNRRIAAWVLGLMGTMAALGLTFALWTTKERRAHDTGVPRARKLPVVIEPSEQTPVKVTPRAPARWEALGYLPDDTDLVAGVRVAELRERRDGRALLETPIKIGGQTIRLDQLAARTGLPLEQIDEIVLGMRVEDPKQLRLALVVRTLKPYGQNVRAQLTREKPTESDGKKLYPLDLFSIPQVLWLADERTLVISLLASQLATVPATPAKDLHQLVPPLRNILERPGPGSPILIAGNPRRWGKSVTTFVLSRFKPELREALQTVQTFAVWLGPEGKEVTLGDFECENPRGVTRLAAELHRLLGAAPRLKTFPDNNWLSTQLRIDPDTLRDWLRR